MDRSLKVLCAALALLVGSSVGASPIPHGLEGLWQVEDSACQGCDPAHGPEVGAMMRIGPATLQNPFGQDCYAEFVMTLQTSDTVASLKDKYDLPLRWLPQGLAPDAGVAERWALSCQGQPAGLLISVSGGKSLLLPVEPSTLIRFLKVSAP